MGREEIEIDINFKHGSKLKHKQAFKIQQLISQLVNQEFKHKSRLLLI